MVNPIQRHVNAMAAVRSANQTNSKFQQFKANVNALVTSIAAKIFITGEFAAETTSFVLNRCKVGTFKNICDTYIDKLHLINTLSRQTIQPLLARKADTPVKIAMTNKVDLPASVTIFTETTTKSPAIEPISVSTSNNVIPSNSPVQNYIHPVKSDKPFDIELYDAITTQTRTDVIPASKRSVHPRRKNRHANRPANIVLQNSKSTAQFETVADIAQSSKNFILPENPNAPLLDAKVTAQCDYVADLAQPKNCTLPERISLNSEAIKYQKDFPELDTKPVEKQPKATLRNKDIYQRIRNNNLFNLAFNS